MKSLIQQASAFSSTGSKVVLALIFTSAISIFSISSALADHDNGHHKRGKWHGNYGHKKGHDNRDKFLYRPRYEKPYIYAQPVYVPPPVYYPPQQSPGISLFFPLNTRHR